MPRYKFVGSVERVLTGLRNGVEAVLHRVDHGQPDGSTVVALPGDEIETTEPYLHSEMVNVETGVSDLEAAVDADPAVAKRVTAAAKRAAKAAEKKAADKAAVAVKAAEAAVVAPAAPDVPTTPAAAPADAATPKE